MVVTPPPAKRHRAVLFNVAPFSGRSHVGPRRRQEARSGRRSNKEVEEEDEVFTH